MEYTNRRGDRYYVFQGKTKSGKPKYYSSKQPESSKGTLVDSLPAEFEIHETPSDARVYVRRRKPTRIIPPERDLVHRLAKTQSAYSNVQTVVEGDCIVVYTPATDSEHAEQLLEGIFGIAAAARLEKWTQRNTPYNAEVRFCLVDADKRTYATERYCYLGSIDRWITISGPGSLDSLAKKILPHLGRESFFELGS